MVMSKKDKILIKSLYEARNTMEFLKQETPVWLPNSPALNTVDYKVWATMEQRLYQRRIHDTDELIEQLTAT